MVSVTATTAEMQDNFGRYLAMVMDGDEVIITKDGKEVGRFIPKRAAVSSLTDSLTGILRGNSEPNEEREKALRAKYKISD